MMVFPFTVPLDGSGRMLDAAQGVYARSLARTLVERLSEPPRLQANLAQLTADGPLDGENGLRGHGWVVASQPWTLEEACHIGLPDGTEFLLHGSAELTDRVRIRILLVDSPQKQLALDHIVLRPGASCSRRWTRPRARSRAPSARRRRAFPGRPATSRPTWPICAAGT